MSSQLKRIDQMSVLLMSIIFLMHNATAASAQEKTGATARQDNQETIEQQWDEFSELAIQMALKFDSRANSQAVNFVVVRGIVDARFDEPVGKAIKSSPAVSSNRASDSTQMLSAAIRLLPQTTIDPQERIGLILDFISLQDERIYRGIKTSFSYLGARSEDPVILAISYLSVNQETLGKELLQRYEQGLATSTDYAAAALINSDAQALIPHLFAACKSDDPLIRDASFLSLETLLRQRDRKPAPEVKRSLSEIDSKTVEYVKRIIARNDTNKDGALSPDEWENMLVDPSAADIDKDGKITVEEYAAWTTSRPAK